MGQIDQRRRTKIRMEAAAMRTVWIHLSPHALTMPMTTRHHFHGSVIQTRSGIHDARRVTPEAYAYMDKRR